MKTLYLSILCLLPFAQSSFAQSVKKQLVVIGHYDSGSHSEQATETIEATNTINHLNQVDYKAGRSITLLSGFEAKTGSTFTAVIQPIDVRGELSLQVNTYPNPFDYSTKIDYYLPADGKVNLWVVDANGKIVGQLVKEENQYAGKHQVEWKPQNLDAGIYIPIIEANQQKATSRLIKK